MQAVLRTYSGKGAKELFDVLEERAAEVEELLRSVKGFVGYTLTRSDDGGFSVTVCNDKAESTRAFKRQRTGSRRTRQIQVWPRRKYRRARSSFT